MTAAEATKPTVKVRRVTRQELEDQLRAQGVPAQHFAFICPMCKTVQSACSLRAAGAGDTPEQIHRYLAFSCVGRFTGAGPYRPAAFGAGPRGREDPAGEGCDWTLGGFFQIQHLEVVMEDGNIRPCFEPATPEQAQQLMASVEAGEGPC